VCAKRLTSATASIAAIKTIHEVIKQKANRSVNCIDETKISCVESSSCNSGSGNSNNGSNGNHNEWWRNSEKVSMRKEWMNYF